MPLLRNPQTGEIVNVQNAAALEAQGWQPPTDADLEAKSRELEYGTGGQLAQAQIERVVRGATLGQVEGFGSAEENRARAEVSEELMPGTSFVADIVPDVALSAATGGLGSAAKLGRVGVLAAEALGSGAVTASQTAFQEGRQFLHDDIGRDVEQTAIWTGLGFALGARGATRAARAETRAAAEVAGEKELTEIAQGAEARAAAGAEPVPTSAAPAPPVGASPLEEGIPAGSAAAGAPEAIPGAAAGIPGEVPTGAVSSVAERAAQRQATEAAAEGGLERALRNASRSEADDIVERAVRGEAGDATGKAAKSLERAGADVAEEAAGAEERSLFRDRRLYANRDAIYETATREMQEDVTSAMRDLRAITDDKAALAAKSVSDNVAAQRAAARSVAEDAAKWSGALRVGAKISGAEAGKKGLQFAIPAQKTLATALLDHAKELGKATNGAEMFSALNRLKQVADDFKLSLEKGAANSTNPLHHEQLIPQVAEFANKIRAQLEDANVWGKAGEIQAAYNGTFTDKFLPSFKQFEEAVLQRTHKGYDGMWATEGWENKIKALLQNTDPGARRHVGQMLDGMREFAETRLKYGGDKQSAERVMNRVDKIRRTMGLADEVGDATTRMGAAGKVASIFPVVGPAARSYLTGDLGMAFRRLTQSTEAITSRSVDDWIRSSKVRGGSRAPTRRFLPRMNAEQKALYDLAKRRGMTQTLARFTGEDESPYQAFERRRAALMDEDGFFNRTAGDFGQLTELSPEAGMMLAGKAAEARKFLVDRMPANVAVSLARPGGYPPSMEAIEDWAVYVNAVEDPVGVVKNLPAMRIQEAETLQTLFPRLWEGTQQTVLEKIGSAQANGDPLDDTMLMRMDLLFNFDGAGSSAFSVRSAKATETAAPPPQQVGSSSSGPSDAKRLAPGGPALTGATMGTLG